VRGRLYSVAALTDDDYDTYWATHDGVNKAQLDIDFGRETKLNRIRLQEYIPLGQRVKLFVVEYLSGTQWVPVKINEETTTIGYCRLLRFPTISTRHFRIRFLDARACLCINSLGAYFAPNAKDRYVEDVAQMKGLPFTVRQTSDAVLMDLGSMQTIGSLHYQPANSGLISSYEIYAGTDSANMRKMASGEFSNIRNNPIMQDVYFSPVEARYVELRAVRMVTDGERIRYEKLIVK
jgi:alpha-L-fucosidase